VGATRRAPFELALPEDAIPSGRGRDCSVLYALRARARGGSVLTPGWAPIEVTARGLAHIEPRITRFDRFLGDFPARHFHIELSDAHLAGGGYIAGRVHRHGPADLGSITITVSCSESWRCLPPWIAAPQWESSVLWTATAPVELDGDRAWAAFRFDIPADLPGATEAHAIAWRYELTARRRVRHPQQCATITPLLSETV